MKKSRPQYGEVRFRTWFAFRPVYVKGKRRWLKWVTVEQVYLQGFAWVKDYWDNEAFIEQ